MRPSLSLASQQSFTGVNLAARASAPLRVARLVTGDEAEALKFLSARPLHTVIMSGLICDNGLESPYNRGYFYGCRAAHGELIGLVLVGHVTLFEARRTDALLALARSVPVTRSFYTILGETKGVRLFCRHHAQLVDAELRVRRDQFMVLRESPVSHEPVSELKLATLAQLEHVMSANAEMAERECGLNPLRVDAEGFRARTARHIKQGRIWVWLKNDRLVFKVDVASETPEAVYLEGLYVDPAERGQGYAPRCLSRLSRLMLERERVLCLLVEEENATAKALYRHLGFEVHCTYDRVTLTRSLSSGEGRLQ